MPKRKVDSERACLACCAVLCCVMLRFKEHVHELPSCATAAVALSSVDVSK